MFNLREALRTKKSPAQLVQVCILEIHIKQSEFIADDSPIHDRNQEEKSSKIPQIGPNLCRCSAHNCDCRWKHNSHHRRFRSNNQQQPHNRHRATNFGQPSKITSKSSGTASAVTNCGHWRVIRQEWAIRTDSRFVLILIIIKNRIIFWAEKGHRRSY